MATKKSSNSDTNANFGFECKLWAADAPLAILNTPAEACVLAERLGEAVRPDAIATKKYEDARCEARRRAGASPRTEVSTVNCDESGMPVAIRKEFQY